MRSPSPWLTLVLITLHASALGQPTPMDAPETNTADVCPTKKLKFIAEVKPLKTSGPLCINVGLQWFAQDETPPSSFNISVDTGSYSNIFRKEINVSSQPNFHARKVHWDTIELEPSIQFKCHATQIPSFFIFKIDWKNTETNAAETLVLNVFVSIGA
jgi:hypothetical protein